MKTTPFLIHPDTPALRAWRILVAVAAVVSVLVAPVVLALNLGNRRDLYILDIAINIVFVADVLINFRLAYFENHELVCDLRRIRYRYLTSWFIVDALAALPVFLFVGPGYLILNRALRFLRLARVMKIFSLFRSLNHLKRTKVSSNALRMLLLGFWLSLTAHIIACGFILSGGVEAGLSNGMTYLLALYWTITTLATVGYGDIVPDRTNPAQLIFTICAQIAGVGMYGYVIGSISSIIYNIDLSKTLFMERMEKMYAFLHYRKISPKVMKQVDEYLDYLWETRRGHEETVILDGLPPGIRLAIARELHSDVLAKVPVFKTADESLIRDILLHLEPIICPPGDCIVRAGDIGDAMYFINRGYVDVLSPDLRTVYATLTEGAFFGEIALLFSVTRSATIRAGGYCDLYALKKSSFDRILVKHPVFAQTVQTFAQTRRTEHEAGKLDNTVF